jgi:transcription termination factor Rho
LICADLLSVANAEIHLRSELARARVFPAIDISSLSSTYEGEGAQEIADAVRENYLPKYGEARLRISLRASANKEKFLEKINGK